MQIYVRDVMSRGAISVKPADSLADAREQLRAHRIHHLLVLDGNRVVGVVSYRDLIGKTDGLTVGAVMSRDVVMVGPTDNVRVAAAQLLGRTHGCAAVVEGDVVVGILTTTDLVRAVSHTAEPVMA